MTNIFKYFILFNFHDKAHRVLVILPILLNRKLRLTGVDQLAQSYAFNWANIIYIFCRPGPSTHSCSWPDEEALPLGVVLWGGAIWTGSWLNYRLWPDRGRRQGYSGTGSVSIPKTQVRKVEGVLGRWCVDCFGCRGGFVHVMKRHPAGARRTMKTASAIVVFRELQAPLRNEDQQGWPSLAGSLGSWIISGWQVACSIVWGMILYPPAILCSCIFVPLKWFSQCELKSNRHDGGFSVLPETRSEFLPAPPALKHLLWLINLSWSNQDICVGWDVLWSDFSFQLFSKRIINYKSWIWTEDVGGNPHEAKHLIINERGVFFIVVVVGVNRILNAI